MGSTRCARRPESGGGANITVGQSRLDVLSENAGLIRSVMGELDRAAPEAAVVVAGNPVDVLTRLAIECSARPEPLIMGTGTLVDTARLRYQLAMALGASLLQAVADESEDTLRSRGRDRLPSGGRGRGPAERELMGAARRNGSEWVARPAREARRSATTALRCLWPVYGGVRHCRPPAGEDSARRTGGTVAANQFIRQVSAGALSQLATEPRIHRAGRRFLILWHSYGSRLTAAGGRLGAAAKLAGRGPVSVLRNATISAVSAPGRVTPN
jgi:hypothetical protein